MNWHVYRKDDPSTWPEIDCPMLVCRWFSDILYELKIMYWDRDKSLFYYTTHMGMSICEEDELYYVYVGYIPNGYQVLHPVKCGCVDENGNEYRCPYGMDDDGYCMYDEEICEYKKIVNEYALNDNLRIWKEFEI